ncbi:MAG TPA: ATP-binding protein [Candidatus Limnocylindrales bacterium]|nr:ATP-binding protein [Candidatus Limnocylindrales bacterium]
MSAQGGPSPLAVAALAFIRDQARPSGLVGRFGQAGAVVAEPLAAALLDELTGLGLLRVVRGASGEDEYFLTPLGERLREASFVGQPEQVDMLAEIEQMRTDLLATIAHELRTPLTAMRTSVGLLVDPAIEPTSEQRAALLDTLDRNTTRMQRVVGDILDLARFRAGRVQLQLRRFDAAELAKSAVASVVPIAAVRHQTIELDLPPGPVWVFGDYRRLEQALVNLLSNAEKYSPDGAPISVSLTQASSDVAWTVRDAGPGIKPADRARLFERFFVGRRDRSEATPGIGLGLPISLLIVQAHDGRIDVGSRPGHGSSFSIVVPMAGPREVPDE